MIHLCLFFFNIHSCKINNEVKVTYFLCWDTRSLQDVSINQVWYIVDTLWGSKYDPDIKWISFWSYKRIFVHVWDDSGRLLCSRQIFSKSCTCRKSMTHSNWGAIKIELISLCKAIEIPKQPRMNYLFPPIGASMHRRTRFDCPTFKCVYEMTQTWKYVYTGIVTWPIFEHFLKFQCRA